MILIFKAFIVGPAKFLTSLLPFFCPHSQRLFSDPKIAQTAWSLSKEDNVLSTNSDRAMIVECLSVNLSLWSRY